MSGDGPVNPILGQADTGLFLLLGVVVVIVAGAFVILLWVRRRLSPNEDFHGEGFTLGDLRRLHKTGKLSDEEFEKAKQGLIAAAQVAAQQRDEEKKNLREMGWDTPERR